MNYQQLLESVQELKQSLAFPPEAQDIPDELLMATLLYPEKKIDVQKRKRKRRQGERVLSSADLVPQELLRNLREQWGIEDYDKLEFLGDAVLELAIVDELFNRRQEIPTVGDMSTLKKGLVQNANLYCKMNQENLCRLLVIAPDVPIDDKICADVFEAIVGAMYYYLQLRGVPNSVQIIREWLLNTLQFAHTLYELQTTGTSTCLARGESLTPKEDLAELYRIYALGKPRYNVIQRKAGGKRWIIGVRCPPQLTCPILHVEYETEQRNPIIGLGVAAERKQAEKEAATEALHVIRTLMSSMAPPEAPPLITPRYLKLISGA